MLNSSFIIKYDVIFNNIYYTIVKFLQLWRWKVSELRTEWNHSIQTSLVSTEYAFVVSYFMGAVPSIADLSGGQKGKLLLLHVVLESPQLLILDEPPKNFFTNLTTPSPTALRELSRCNSYRITWCQLSQTSLPKDLSTRLTRFRRSWDLRH